MAGETPYRIAAACLLIATLAVGGYHRRRADRLGAPFSRRDEPLPILIPLRLLGLATILCIVAYLVRPTWVWWALVPLPAWLRWAGLAVSAAALALVFWTLRSLGHNLTDTVGTRANSYLVTTGPYRYVRHPFYAAVGLHLAGAALLTAMWFVAAAGASVLALLAFRTPIEEAKLVERFGDAYRAYAAHTGRYFPRLGR